VILLVSVVTSTQNPQQLQTIIAELETVIEQVPAGKHVGHMRTYLADALEKFWATTTRFAFLCVVCE
jgi:N-acyl-D-aspartate/D-glutamate deacylase